MPEIDHERTREGIHIEIFCDTDKEARGIQCLSFKVDGQSSGKWFHKCKVEGLPENYYIDRCINLLKGGHSREAFGGPVVTMQQGASDTVVGRLGPDKGRGEVFTVEKEPVTVTSRSGKEVVRTLLRWKYKLDGNECKDDFPTEAKAREACAFAAFMSRGKLGRFAEAEAKFKEVHGKDGKMQYDGKAYRLLSDKEEYAVNFSDPNGITFKPVLMDGQAKE